MAQDLQLQLHAACELYSSAYELASSLHDSMQAYKCRIDNLVASGVAIQIADSYSENICNRNRNTLRQIYESIENRELPWIRNIISKLSNAIDQGQISTKAESFRKASEKVQQLSDRLDNLLLMKAKKDSDGQPQNERQYIAYNILNNRTK